MTTDAFTLRRATPSDVPALRRMHRRSLRGLGDGHYSAAQIDGLFATVETVDPALIAAGTYYLADVGGEVAGSGGWTLRRPAYEDRIDAGERRGRIATMRAIFVDPAFARRGIARAIMTLAESEAILFGEAEGFDLVATLSGLPLYRVLGYRAGARVELPLDNGLTFPGVRMTKSLAGAHAENGETVRAARRAA